MNPSKLVCVLLVEADPADAQLLQIGLRQFKETPLEVTRVGADTGQPQKTVDSRLKNMHFEVSWVQTLEAALHKLGSAHFDVVLLDLALPDGQGFAAIRTLKQKSETLPIIVLLPPNAVDAAETAISTGANGYIVKNDAGYVDLVRVLRYVLHRADVKTRNQLLVAGLEATSNAIIITDKEARIEWANPAFAELTGYSFQETLGRTPTELLKSGLHDAAFYQHMWQHLLERGHWQGEIVNRHKSGGLYNADVGISAVYNKDGSLSGYVQMQRDITDSVVRLAISEVLRQSTPLEQRFRELLDICLTSSRLICSARAAFLCGLKTTIICPCWCCRATLAQNLLPKNNASLVVRAYVGAWRCRASCWFRMTVFAIPCTNTIMKGCRHMVITLCRLPPMPIF